MAISTPTVRPPSSLDLDDELPPTSGAISGAAQPLQATTAAAPAATGGYQAPQTARRADTMAEPLQGFAQAALSTPSRYDSDFMQNAIGQVNAEMEFSQGRAEESLDEHISSRGLVGSDIETRGRGDMLAQLNIAKGQRLQDLTREMANTFAQDRATSASIGMQTGDYLGRLDTRDINDARYGSEFGRLTGRDAASDQQFQQTLDTNRDQFAQQMGFSREQMDQQRDQFMLGLQDTRDARADALGMQQDSQEWQSMENTRNRALEMDALQLQRDGLDAETAWRTADRQLDAQIAASAQALEAQGLSQQQAYQQATLQMDAARMNQNAEIANQQAGLSAQDIYLRALAAGAGDELEGGLPQYQPQLLGTGYVAPELPSYGGDPAPGGLLPPSGLPLNDLPPTDWTTWPSK